MLDSISEQLLANESAARALLEALSSTQLNWQPENGQAWSVAQCIEHLSVSNEQYMSALLPAVGSAPASPGSFTFQPSAAGAWFIRFLEPPAGRKAKAPARLRPASHLEKETVLARFLASHHLIRQAIAGLAGKNPNTIRFRNPLLPILRVKAGSGLMIVTAHERRHLWQAREVSAKIPARI